MHLYFLTRGIKQQRDLFVKFMETQMWKWTRKNIKTGKDEVCQAQGGLRPVELWEYVFPEECLAEVLTMLDIDPTTGRNCGISKAKRYALRKMLGVKPIPLLSKVPTNKFVEKRGVQLYPIGIKEDVKTINEAWGYEQEML